MIDQLTAFFDIVGLAKETQKKMNLDKEDVDALTGLFGKARSISSAAAKYIIEYPVAISNRVSDFKTALSIAKQVELECARFIILTSGLNPVVDMSKDDSIKAHLSNLTTSVEGLSFNIGEPNFREVLSAEEYMNDIYSAEEYNSFKKSAFSQELQIVDVDSVAGDDDLSAGGGVLGNKLKDAKRETIKNATELNTTMNKLSKIGPTIINVNLILANDGGISDKEISVPLAIKATLQYIDSTDITQIVENTNSSSKKLLDFIKLTSGQTRFFRGFLFQLDKVAADIERERQLGAYPFYRRLIDAKNRYRIKSIKEMIPIIGKFIGSKTQKDMPMCTIVVTTDELVDATKLHFNYILKNKQHIQNIIDTYMLLCFGIVDELNSVVYYFYSGIPEPTIIELSKLGNTGGDDGNINAKLIESLAKVVIRK